MNRPALCKNLAIAFLLLTSGGIALAQSAPDLTGKNSSGPPPGMAPDLTGKSNNAMFSPNAMRARAGTAPDLTGKVQENHPFVSGENQTTGSGNNMTIIVVALLIIGLVIGTVVYLKKSTKIA